MAAALCNIISLIMKTEIRISTLTYSGGYVCIPSG